MTSIGRHTPCFRSKARVVRSQFPGAIMRRIVRLDLLLILLTDRVIALGNSSIWVSPQTNAPCSRIAGWPRPIPRRA